MTWLWITIAVVLDVQCRGEQIAAAIISSPPSWGLKLRALLADIPA